MPSTCIPVSKHFLHAWCTMLLESLCCLYSMLSESCSWSFQCLFSASYHRVVFFKKKLTYNSGHSVNWIVLFWYSRALLSRVFLSLSALILVYHIFAFRTDFCHITIYLLWMTPELFTLLWSSHALIEFRERNKTLWFLRHLKEFVGFCPWHRIFL